MRSDVPRKEPLTWIIRCWLMTLIGLSAAAPISAAGDPTEEWEITADSELALRGGLNWLAVNQGPEGNWGSNDLGLVSMGVLALLADGHAPGRGKFGPVLQKAIDYIVDNARPSGLLNISNSQRDMYNHGLATFVLGQAHGTNTARDQRLTRVLDRALKLIANTQCDDGGWDYHARRKPSGHDLSLVVMQAKALRSAMDSGLRVPPEVVALALRSVREHYAPKNGKRGAPEADQREGPGQFAYGKGGGGDGCRGCCLSSGIRSIRRLAYRQEHQRDRSRDRQSVPVRAPGWENAV